MGERNRAGATRRHDKKGPRVNARPITGGMANLNEPKPAYEARRGQKNAVTGGTFKDPRIERVQRQSSITRTKSTPKQQRTPTAGKGNIVRGKISTKIRRIARKVSAIPGKVKRALE